MRPVRADEREQKPAETKREHFYAHRFANVELASVRRPAALGSFVYSRAFALLPPPISSSFSFFTYLFKLIALILYANMRFAGPSDARRRRRREHRQQRKINEKRKS